MDTEKTQYRRILDAIKDIMNNPICQRNAICILVSLLSMLAASPSFSQVVIKDKVEVDGAVASTQAIEGIGFVATRTEQLKLQLGTAARHNISPFPVDQVFLNVYNNGNLILSKKVFEEDWTLSISDAPCLDPIVNYVPTAGALGIELDVGHVDQGDEITIRLVTDQGTLGASPGSVVNGYLDSSTISYSGGGIGLAERWNVQFKGVKSSQCLQDYFLEDVNVVFTYPPYVVTAVPDTIAVADTTTIEVVVTNPPSAGEFDLDLTLSDSTKGYLELIHELEGGLYEIEQAGHFLAQVPYSALDPSYGATDRFVHFIAQAPSSGSKRGNSINEVAYDSLQVTAKHSTFNLPNTSAVGTIYIGIEQASIEILDASGLPAEYLQIARWDNGYYIEKTGVIEKAVLINTPDSSFISLDPNHFVIKVKDLSANTLIDDVHQQDFIEVGIQTLTPSGAVEDSMHQIVLGEKDGEFESGEFWSPPQLLVTQDFQVQPYGNLEEYFKANDDEFRADNGMNILFPGWVDADDASLTGGPVDDEMKTDPTHQIQIGGSVKVEYTRTIYGLFQKTEESQAWVCNPDSLRDLELRVTVFNEPFEDTGYKTVNALGDTIVVGAGNGEFDWEGKSGGMSVEFAWANGNATENYLDFSSWVFNDSLPQAPKHKPGKLQQSWWSPVMTPAHITSLVERARLSWSQACVRILWDGSVTIKDAPKIGGSDISSDAFLDGRYESVELEKVYEMFEHRFSKDIVDVFVIGGKVDAGNAKGSGVAILSDRIKEANYNGNGQFSYLYITTSLALPKYRTLDHEIGHVLTLLDDVPTGMFLHPSYILFPQEFSEYNEPTNIYDFNDNGWDDEDIRSIRRLSKTTVNKARQSGYLKPSTSIP